MTTHNWQEMVIYLLDKKRNTQLEVQDFTGIDQSTISRIKGGQKHKGITYEKAIKLIEMYNRQLDKEKIIEPTHTSQCD